MKRGGRNCISSVENSLPSVYDGKRIEEPKETDMKRAMALMAALCLLLACVSAHAETVQERTVLDFDVCTVTVEPGMAISADSATVFPFAASGDTTTKIQFGRLGIEPCNPAYEGIQSAFEGVRDSVINEDAQQSYEANGVHLESFELGDPAEIVLAGANGYYAAGAIVLSLTADSTQQYVAYTGYLMFFDKAFYFVLTGNDPDLFVRTANILEEMIRWK